MLRVMLRYRDRDSKFQWRDLECIVLSVDEALRIYDLNKEKISKECEYRILSVFDLATNKYVNYVSDVHSNEHIYYSGNNKTKKSYDVTYKSYGTYSKHCCLKKKGW